MKTITIFLLIWNLSHSIFPQTISRFIIFSEPYSLNEIDSVLANIRDLDSIQINSNISELPENIRKYKNLNTLIITSKKLKQLPNWLSEFKFLKNLYISNSFDLSYKNIHSVLSSLHCLEKLTLYNLDLDSIPIGIIKSNNIIELDIRKNNILSLPRDLYNDKNIEVLLLDYNKIENDREFFNILGTLSNIRYLSIIHNSIDTVYAKLLLLKNLEYLNLSENIMINELPLEFSELSNLRVLLLDKTGIKFLPKSITKLTKLVFLSIRDTPITENEILYIKKYLPKCAFFY